MTTGIDIMTTLEKAQNQRSTIKYVASQLKISHSSASRMLKALERKGWLNKVKLSGNKLAYSINKEMERNITENDINELRNFTNLDAADVLGYKYRQKKRKPGIDRLIKDTEKTIDRFEKSLNTAQTKLKVLQELKDEIDL